MEKGKKKIHTPTNLKSSQKVIVHRKRLRENEN